MNLSRIFLGVAILAASLGGQSGDPVTQQPGARLVLAPSEPLTEPRFPKPKTETKPLASLEQRAGTRRPAILDLKPAGDHLSCRGA
jgi:hypothetical protein